MAPRLITSTAKIAWSGVRTEFGRLRGRPVFRDTFLVGELMLETNQLNVSGPDILPNPIPAPDPEPPPPDPDPSPVQPPRPEPQPMPA
jgi:hypothetical protein